MQYAVIFIAFLLILTKLADVLSTLRQITHPDDERNPWANQAMKRFGVGFTVWSVFAISFVIIILATVLVWNSSALSQWGFILVGTGVACVQGAVAHHNITRRSNPLIRGLQVVYAKLGRSS